MEWTLDGWLRLANGTNLPETDVEISGMLEHSYPKLPARDDFDAERLRLEYQFPYVPQGDEHLSLSTRPGYLRMYGRDGLASRYAQTMIARRWTEFSFDVSCELEFEPENFKQMAGLILLYDLDNFLYLHVSRDEDEGKILSIMHSVNREITYPAAALALPDGQPVFLKAEVRDCMVQFFYLIDHSDRKEQDTLHKEERWISIGTPIPADFLSDEACEDGWFSGAMCGICCQDLTGSGKYADFDWFTYDPVMAENEKV